MECHRCPLNGKGSDVCIACATGQVNIPENSKGQNPVGYEVILGTHHEPSTSVTAVDEISESETRIPKIKERILIFLNSDMRLSPEQRWVSKQFHRAEKSKDHWPSLKQMAIEMNYVFPKANGKEWSKEELCGIMDSAKKDCPEIEILFETFTKKRNDEIGGDIEKRLLDYSNRTVRLTQRELFISGQFYLREHSTDCTPTLDEMGIELDARNPPAPGTKNTSKAKVKWIMCSAIRKCPAIEAMFPFNSFNISDDEREKALGELKPIQQWLFYVGLAEQSGKMPAEPPAEPEIAPPKQPESNQAEQLLLFDFTERI